MMQQTSATDHHKEKKLKTVVLTQTPLAALIALSVLSMVPSPALANENVILQHKDGALTISGSLESSDAENYVIDSPQFGRITVDKERFICVGRDCPKDTTFTASIGQQATAPVLGNDFGVHGSNTVGGQLMPALINGYVETVGGKARLLLGSDPEQSQIDLLDKASTKIARIDLKAKGSGTSFPSLLDGSASLGMSSRPAKDKEVASLINAGLGDIRASGQEHVIALDGIIMIVANDNPVKTLSIDQVSAIYAGEITDWSEVGGNPGPIVAYTRPTYSGTYDTFKSLVMKPSKRELAPTLKELEANVEISDSVAADSSAIGYVPFAFERNAQSLSIATSCGITTSASVFDVKTEEYPLARRLYLYTTNRPIPEHAEGLLDYALSKEASKHVNDVGFIDLSVSNRHFNQQTLRLATALNVPEQDFNAQLMRDFVVNFGNHERLSKTFRFKPGSANLENLSQQQLQQFVEEMSAGKLSNKSIRLVGFADSVGNFELNRDLSLKRGESVKAAILNASGGTLDPSRIEVHGYGELMPVGCNTDDEGRKKNRRVEVWVKAE